MHQLIYRSQATQAFNHAQLMALLEQARAFNLSQDVTGLLLYTPDQQFLQVLEGDERAVQALYYNHIAADLRHTDCFVLAEEAGVRRGFPDWSMGFLMHEHADVPTSPGFVEVSRLRLLLPLLTRVDPWLREVLLDFVEQR